MKVIQILLMQRKLNVLWRTQQKKIIIYHLEFIYLFNVVSLSDESKRFIGNENSIKGVCGVFSIIYIQTFQK